MNRSGAPLPAAVLVVLGCGGGGLRHGTIPECGAAGAEQRSTTDVSRTVDESERPLTTNPVVRSGDSSTTPLSEPPVTLTVASRPTSALADLTITRSHFYLDPKAKTRNSWTWLAVVRSARHDLACDLTVEGEFVVPNARSVTIFANVAAPPYGRPGTSSVYRCVAPGEIGVASGSTFAGTRPVPPSSVVEIRYAISGIPSTELTPSDWVTLGGVRLATTDRGRVVRGKMANGSRPMPWWEVDIYPFDAEKMPLTQFVLLDPRTQLAPGETWEFETPPLDASFDDAYVFVRHGRAQ